LDLFRFPLLIAVAPNRHYFFRTQERLCFQYRKLSRAGKPITIVTTAIARQLAGFVWAIAHEVCTPTA